MNSERYEREKRIMEFPRPILDLYAHNPVICQIVKLYADEQIITKEEALCHMVVRLARGWESEMNTLMRGVISAEHILKTSGR